MIKLAAQVVPIRLNSEKEGQELAQKYGVSGLPTILFLEASGEVAGRIGGYLPADGYVAETERILSARTEFTKLAEQLKKSPNDGELNAKLAVLLVGRGQRQQAEAAAKRSEKSGYKGDALAQACSSIGESYVRDNKFKDAIEYLNAANSGTKTPKILSKAKMLLMVCHYLAEDIDAAKKIAQEIVALKGAEPDHLDAAQRLLKED